MEASFFLKNSSDPLDPMSMAPDVGSISSDLTPGLYLEQVSTEKISFDFVSVPPFNVQMMTFPSAPPL